MAKGRGAATSQADAEARRIGHLAVPPPQKMRDVMAAVFSFVEEGGFSF